MQELNYAKRLQNIQGRKFDRELNETILTKSFSTTDLPENIKYLLESMRPIDQKYNEKTYDAANRVKKHLQDGFDLHFNRAFETQGSIMTGTNIKVYSDFDLLTIVDRYHFLGPGLPNENKYNDSSPDNDIYELRKQSIKILNDIYDEVDTSGTKSISIYNKSLKRKVDIVFCFWYHTKEYVETQNKYYKGIYLYEFPTKTKLSDFPFAHMNNVNEKGDKTLDGSRKGIRLLKNLKADADSEIKLSSFHLTSIVHSIADNLILYQKGKELNIAIEISKNMSNIIQNSDYRKAIKSPNGTEFPFYKDELVPEIVKLKNDLDMLIADCSKEFYNNYFQKSITIYS